MTTTKKFIIGILLLLAGLATGAASAQGIGYTPPPYVLYDSTGNPFPTGSGTALNFMPPAFTCYTIVASAVVPCSFSGGGGSSSTWPPTAQAPTFSPSAGAIAPGTTVTAACSSGTPYISTGTAAVAGGTGITVSSAETLYGSCQGSGYFTTGSAAYTATTTTYINTTFNEASAGAALAGTTPATCASGCVGPWALLNGNDWLYQSGGGAAITVTTANADYINSGQANETIRWTVTSSSSVNLNMLAHVTHTATANYFKVILNGSTGSVVPANVASGVTTNACTAIPGTVVGSYVLVLSGTSFTLTAPSGSCSGSLSASATGTEVGFAADTGASALSAFSVKSN
jgi:hypothetical protein